MDPIIEISNQNLTPARFMIIVYYHPTTNLSSLNAPPLRTNKSLKHINIIVIDAIAYNYYNARVPDTKQWQDGGRVLLLLLFLSISLQSRNDSKY